MSHGNDRLRHWGTRALILAFLLGSLTAIENRFQPMRLSDVTLKPPMFNMEKTLMQAMPQVAERFWPLALFYLSSCRKQMENIYPIKARGTITGWGKFGFYLTPRTPLLRLRWNEQEWTVSVDGKIWPRDHDLKCQREQTRLPLLEWSEDLSAAAVIDTTEEHVVLNTLLPLIDISQWLEYLSKTRWTKKPYRVRVDKTVGNLTVEIRGKVGRTQIILLLPSETSRWPQIFEALDDIFKGLTGAENWVKIDATYSDKIVVKRKSL